MSRTEEMMSSTASDQITITRSSRCEIISVGKGFHISLTHYKRCALLLFSTAEIQDGAEDLDLVFQVDCKTSVLRAAAGRGGGLVGWSERRKKTRLTV